MDKQDRQGESAQFQQERDRRPKGCTGPADPKWADSIANEGGLWHESPQEIEAGIRWGARKRLLLSWVHRQMALRLTDREQRSIVLYYLESRSYRQVAAAMDVSPPTAHRLVRRGIAKLRAAAASDPPRLPRMR